MQAKPVNRPDASVKSQIRWLVNRLHVATPDDDVRADIEQRVANGKPADGVRIGKGYARACGDYAVAQHRKNGDLCRAFRL